MSNILKLYFWQNNSSYESKNWNEPDSLLNYIIKFQNMYASSDIMPSNLKINTEIWYNNLDIFISSTSLHCYWFDANLFILRDF